jgi:hypothetical protein
MQGWNMRLAAIACLFVIAVTSLFPQIPSPPKPGFVINFDFISNVREGRDLVRIAARAGARIINVVPPAHIWENKLAVQMLDGILEEISHHKLSLIFTRIDASYPPERGQAERFHYLYGKILTDLGVMPNGRKTAEYFRTTVGRKGYSEWMEEETRYYAKHYGGYANLLGINLGPFSEPFASERGGFLEYENETQRYEITQYTPEGRDWYHHWLNRQYGSIQSVNSEYGASFAAIEEVPLPLNETDRRFDKPELAYFDFARSLNDWLVENYQNCRRIWHEESGRSDVPFILQFSGTLPEKLVNGHPGHAAFDVPGWIAIADAVGLSLYTNSGYEDFGHASVQAMVNLAALARDLYKDVFVLEGGSEAPNVILDKGELQFYGAVARKLNPKTYIYEFIKDQYDTPYESNPGTLVTSKGKIRRPAFQALQKLFVELSADKTPPEPPAIYYISDSLAARGNPQIGFLNAALYDIASDAAVRWMPKGSESTMHPGVWILTSGGNVSPENAQLSQLMRNIPEVDAEGRETWRRAVLEAIRLKIPMAAMRFPDSK